MIDTQWRDMRRLLVIRLDNLGDVLVTTPAIHAVRECLPEVEITLLASAVGAQAGRLNPDVDQVLVYSAPWTDPWNRLPQDPQREQQMIEAIRDRQFDGAIIFTSFRQSALPAAYLCYLAGIPQRMAASIDGPGSLLTVRHKHPDCMMHEVERGLDLVSAVGFDTAQRDLVLEVPEEQRLLARKMIGAMRSGSGPLVVMHPGCSMPARTYPWEMFAETADLLVEQVDATILLTGSEDERELTERIQSQMSNEAISLAGDLSFPMFAGIIEAADVTVTNNTGPMHMAAALQTPVVALFALTNPPEQWGPWHVPHRQLYHDVPCRICYSRICPYEHECLRLVTPRQVTAACLALMEETEESMMAAGGAR